MPYIKINEVEETSFRTIDSTDNIVLIPLLYVRNFNDITYTEEDVPSAKLYSDVATLKKDMEMTTSTTAKVVTKRYALVDGLTDKSFIMAYELLLQGLKVVIKPIKFDNRSYWKPEVESSEASNYNTRLTFKEYIDILEVAINGYTDSESVVHESAYEEFKNKNLFNLKFITTGGYPNVGTVYQYPVGESGYETLESNMWLTISGVAEARGDALALVELKENILTKADLLTEVNKISPLGENLKSSAAFVPWAWYNATDAKNITMPACFGYLMAYANSVKNNANWFTAAGTDRGYIPGLITGVDQPVKLDIGESLMHTLQGDFYDDASFSGEKISVRINPIYKVGSYGYRIWGNRVLYPTSTDKVKKYQDFLNVRILLCDIKKQIYHAAMVTTFEPNDDIVWINFKSLVNTLLEKMKSGRGISWYNWVKKKSTDKGVITAVLTVKPIEAVESFDITIKLTDEELEVTDDTEVTTSSI